MTETIDLDFCFKGKRAYVHGTDIYTKLIESHNGKVRKVDIAFHGITEKNMSFFPEKPEKKELKVTFRCYQDEKKIALFGVENDTSIDCRYEYLEEKIVDNSAVDLAKQSIFLNTPTKYSPIEHIVAMNKALLEKLYFDVNGKWYFTRLQLQENISMSDILSLQLILKSNFKFKLTKTAIIVNNVEVGLIYFSLIAKES